jgi:FkbM family methyltransferase
VSVIKLIRRKIVAAFAERGIIIQKKTPLNSEEKLVEYLFKKHDIDLVLDVGANTGQFALEILKSGYRKPVISFEPLPAAFDELKKNAADYKNWKAENLAVGTETGSISINVAANSESSSVLPMLKSHSELAPESKYINAITVPITTLDQYFRDKKIEAENIFLKIDVQGYEDSVISGALNALQKVKVLQLEISFIPLYDMSMIYYAMMSKLEGMGYSLYSLLPAFSDYKTGQIFQVDAVYIRK